MDKVRNGPVATFGEFTLYGSGEVGRQQGFSKERIPLAGVRASVEAGAELQKRMTATRVLGGGLLFGPAGAVIGGMAKKKKGGGESWLTIEGPEAFWTVEVKRGDEKKARVFAGKVNDAARKL